MKKIAIDMMGSDNGPLVLLDACKSYLKDHEDVSFLLFGDEKILKEATSGIDRIEVRGTESIIPMEIKPLDFLRSKDSSMYQALAAVKSKEADAVVLSVFVIALSAILSMSKLKVSAIIPSH